MGNLIIHWIPESDYGGCEILLSTFLEGCSAQNKNIIFTTLQGPVCGFWKRYTANIHYLPSWDKNPFQWSIDLKKELLNFQANQFYFISWSTSRLPFLIYAIKKTSFQNAIIHVGNYVGLNTNIRFRLFLERLFLGIIPKDYSKVTFVGCSQYVLKSMLKDSLYKHYRCAGILNGVRSQFFEAYPLTLSAGIRICTVGRLDPMKQHLEMVGMIGNAVKSGCKVECFDIIGEGSEREHLDEMILNEKLQNVVHLCGAKSNVVLELRNHNVFLFNSTHEEGMGIALAEAMAVGLVCVVNNTELMHEIVGDAGFFFSSQAEFNTIIASLNQSFDFGGFSEKVKKRAIKIFSSTKFAENYIKILRICH